MLVRGWIVVVLLACSAASGGCGHPGPFLVDAGGRPVSLAFADSNRASVFVFLDPDCPLSQNYTLTLQRLNDRYEPSGMAVYAVFPGDLRHAAVDSFRTAYRLTIPVFYDPGLEFVRRYKVTVTPEVLLLDAASHVVYRGAIDNWAIDLGKKRSRITENYLDDAMAAVAGDRPVPLARTEPVGCYIEGVQ